MSNTEMVVELEFFVKDIGKTNIRMQAECFEQENFIKLAQSGFYEQCAIYRIEKGYLALSGDPSGTSKWGTQNYFELTQQALSINQSVTKKKSECRRGTVGMLRGSKSGKVGTQFFVMLSDKYPEMAKAHAVIGLIEDEKFLTKLESIKCDFNGKPLNEIKITHIKVLNSPFTDIVNLKRAVHTEEKDSNKPSKRELSELEKQIVEKAYEAKVSIDLDKSLNTRTLWIGNLNIISDSHELRALLETKLGCRLKTFVYKEHYAFIEFHTVELCDLAYERLKTVVIDDCKLKVDYHFPDLPRNKRIKS